jgi:hypothetical protein
MPSPSADDRSPDNRLNAAGQEEPQSRTGKFLQGVFGRKQPPAATAPPNYRSPKVQAERSSAQPPQELIQVVPEPTSWDDGEDSNWDDDVMYEPMAKQPRLVTEKPVEPVESVLSPEIAAAASAPPPPSMMPPPPPAVVENGAPPIAENQTISVNIPRPKNIKYKNKDPQASPATPAPLPASSADKAEPIEFKVKRPTTIKYKAPPVEQPSWLSKIAAPVSELWKKIQGWGDIIPTQLTENPKKILGILAAVLLSIVTSWAVVNFWPHPSSSPVGAVPLAPLTSAAVKSTSPEEALVAAVRSQFSTLASQYPAGLISNLELDNERQLAIVTLGNLWANLTVDQQQQVAQSLWQQARTYQMSKLEMRSGSGQLLARSPVVGQEMVIVSSY